MLFGVGGLVCVCIAVLFARYVSEYTPQERHILFDYLGLQVQVLHKGLNL